MKFSPQTHTSLQTPPSLLGGEADFAPLASSSPGSAPTDRASVERMTCGGIIRSTGTRPAGTKSVRARRAGAKSRLHRASSVGAKPRTPGNQPGYTLIELMVVVMIAILLMVVSLPVAKTVMESGRPREASRIVNTALFTAKARAASSGRLAGVEFVLEQAAAPGSYRCTQMYMCEVPALYMGDTTDARATVNGTGAITFVNNCAASLPSLLGSGQQFEIRFNHRGLWYRVARSGYQIQNFGSLPAPPIGATGAIFQIRRAPVRVGNPVELPKSTAIDMTVSGIGPSGTEFSSLNASTPLQIMFAPAGNAYFPDGAPQGTIHLLVGLTTKVDATATTDPERSNLADGNALWVSVGRMSGIITTNENVPGVGLPLARQFATNREQQGGL